VLQYTHKLSLYFTEFSSHHIQRSTARCNQASLMANLVSQSPAQQLQEVCNTGTMCTAGIISLLTHSCISVALNVVVHPKLTYAHQWQYHQQPQLFRFLLILARFKLPAKQGISCWQKADTVIRNLGLNSCIFFCRLCNVLGKPLQLVALKTKVCWLIRLNLCQRQAEQICNITVRQWKL